MLRLSPLPLLALLAAGPAHAWQVPLYQTSYDPGPHQPGEPIPCTFTNDDGQSFTGTITSDGSGGLVCSGIAEPTQDAAIEASLSEQGLTVEGDCTVVAEGSASLDADPALTRVDDAELDGASLAVYCDDPTHTAPGEVTVLTEADDTVSLTVDAHDHGDHAHEVVVTEVSLDSTGQLVESELSYSVQTPDGSGQLKASFPAQEGTRFEVKVRPVDPQGYAVPVASFGTTSEGFEARVRSLEATVTASGVTVSQGVSGVGFRLDSWGRAGAMNPPTDGVVVAGDCADAHPDLPEPCVSRVELQREGITEFWQTLSDGFEQGWTLATRPPGTDALLLDVALDGAVDWVVDADQQGAQVRTAQGPVLRYEQLLVLDAAGAVVPAEMSATDTGLRLTIPCDASVAYPLTVDPMIKTITSKKKTTGNYK